MLVYIIPVIENCIYYNKTKSEFYPYNAGRSHAFLKLSSWNSKFFQMSNNKIKSRYNECLRGAD